jgi:deoxyadenosine/deoxycytidine kinase
VQQSLESLIAQSDLRHIAIEGVIGAGKTSLAQLLGQYLSAEIILERFEENPFLSKFYDNAERYAFQTQLFFLLSRYKQQQELRQANLFHKFLITDYVFEKDKIFAYLNLEDDELKLYENVMTAIEHSVPTPDLVVYLQSSVSRLMLNIRKRGREFERNMSEQYIKDLNEAYNYFFFRYKAAPLLIVNATQIDFVHNNDDFQDLMKEIFRRDRAAVEYYNPASSR